MSFINKFIGTTSLQPVDTKIYDEALVLFNNAKAQNELLDGHLKSTVVQGSDVDVLPEAVGRFGFDKTSPVPVTGLLSGKRSFRGLVLFIPITLTDDRWARLFSS